MANWYDLLPAVCLTAILAFFSWAVDKSYSFGDDASFLTAISDARAYRASLSEFSYVWRPFYLLVNGDVACLRLLGGLTLCACGALFGYATSRFLRFSGWQAFNLCILAATTCFWLYWLWNPTPHYNLLNLCSLLIFYAALLLAGAYDDRASSHPGRETTALLATSLLAGVALGFVWLAKPTAFSLAIFAGLTWIFAIGLRHRLVRIALAALGAAATIAVAALLIDGSVPEFASRIQRGLANLHARASGGSGYGIFTSVAGPFFPDRLWKVPPVVFFSAAIFIAGLWWARLLDGGATFARRRRFALAISVFLGLMVAISRRLDDGNLAHFPLNHLWYLTPPLILAAGVAGFWRALRARETRRIFWAVIIVATAPIVYGFGTNSTLIRQIAAASVFWFCATAMLAAFLTRDRTRNFVNAVAICGGITTAGLMLGMAARPAIFVAPLWKQSHRMNVGRQGHYLLVDTQTARYVADIKQAARAKGFAQGMPILDLGGHGPGLAFALGGFAPTQPWLAYGKPSDAAFASFALQTERSAVIRNAWVLTSPPDQRAAEATLRALGLNFPRAYELVADVHAPVRGLRHRLWKPRPP